MGGVDTVASVGIAGAFSSGLMGAEGHQSWANKNMQIHPGVESCLHIVAAHEIRATFPLDSVRIDQRYPPNVKEYVYPGSHSDVGGGTIGMRRVRQTRLREYRVLRCTAQLALQVSHYCQLIIYQGRSRSAWRRLTGH